MRFKHLIWFNCQQKKRVFPPVDNANTVKNDVVQFCGLTGLVLVRNASHNSTIDNRVVILGVLSIMPN